MLVVTNLMYYFKLVNANIGRGSGEISAGGMFKVPSMPNFASFKRAFSLKDRYISIIALKGH